MLRNLITLLAIAAIAYPAGLWAPWWIIAVVAALICLIGGARPWPSFLTSFLAGFLLWGALAFYRDHLNEGILSGQMGRLFQDIPAVTLPLVSALIGAFTAGLGGWSGAALRKWLYPER